MKLQNKWFIGAMLGAAVCLVSTSCVDEIKFGNSFLDKAPGGNATIDTVFNSCLLYTSPSPRDRTRSRMPSSA